MIIYDKLLYTTRMNKMESSPAQMEQTDLVREFHLFLDVLGITPTEKGILRSLVETRKRGTLFITHAGERVESVDIVPEMGTEEVVKAIFHAFDERAKKEKTPSLEIEIEFKETYLH